MEIGSKLKQMRQQCGLTQEELANRCDLTKGYISQLENDLTSPSIATLTDLMVALGSSLKNFFSDDDDEQIVFTEEDFSKGRRGSEDNLAGSEQSEKRNGAYSA